HRARRKLYDLARQNDDRPFFLTVSFTHPHDPYQCLQQHWDLYSHDEIPMPTTESIPDDQQDPYSQRLCQQYGLDREPLNEEQIRTARHAYYGSISYIDQQIGLVLDTLIETGFDQSTMIVLTSDHGDMLGERGLWYKKSFFEDSVRVPLIIRLPGASPSRVYSPVSLVDLLPTLMEVSAMTPPSELLDSLDGRSLVGSIHGNDKDERNATYSENLAEGAMAPILMVRDAQYKLIYSPIDPIQLFDLTTDRYEHTNLASDPAYFAERDRLISLARQKWDLDNLNDRVLRSQKQRLFIRSVFDHQIRPDWDYKPDDQAEAQCLRSDRSYNDWAYNDVIGLKHPGSSSK
ncbi:MAG: sulfatase-like hydrolase/transferase, partial [bacterium]